jgi:hypothetical protein
MEAPDIDNAMEIAEFFLHKPYGLAMLFYLYDEGAQTDAAIADAANKSMDDEIIDALKLAIIMPEVGGRCVMLTEKGKVIVERLRAKMNPEKKEKKT